MTLEQLRCFCAVIDTGSFRSAAERLCRSQPAVSQQVKRLEDELGHTLLERRTCRPTPAGERLYRRGAALIAEAEGLTQELEAFDEAGARPLRVGTSDTTALYILPPVVRRFSAALPQTQLLLVNRHSGLIADQVERGELDLGIVTLPVSGNALETDHVFEQELVLVTPREHPLGKRGEVTLDALAEEPMLLLHADTRTGALLRAHFAAEHFQPQVALDTGSFEVIKRYVAEGVGVSFLPRLVITPRDQELAVVHVGGLPRIQIGVVRRRGAYQTKAERLFADTMRGLPVEG